MVTIRYFNEDTEHPAIPPLGIYETISGKVEMIDAIFRQIVMRLRQVLFAKRVPVKQEVKPPVAVWLEQTVR